MQVTRYPDPGTYAQLSARPVADAADMSKSVRSILSAVKQRGDEAVIEFQSRFGGAAITDLSVGRAEFEEAKTMVSEELKQAIRTAADNIRNFHSAQLATDTVIVETMPGVACWYKQVAIEKVGLYIPGGTAPLFSTLLMLAIPAQLAGCSEIVVCTPPDAAGKIYPAVLYTADLLGIRKIFKAGGAQAIAAMGYGTGTIPAVYKIFGPGNQFVTAAKQALQSEGLAIDMPAGPSEVCVIADEAANAAFVAADMLSQAEHGADSQVLLITNSESKLQEVIAQVELQLSKLPRRKIAVFSLQNSRAVLVKNMAEAMQLANHYAPEHLIIAVADADSLAAQVRNAGSVFLGGYSPESVGDYASGTNHTLPTNGYARAYSGVNVASFQKSISFQKISETGLQNIAPTVIAMAEAEGLVAHANAVRVRLNDNTCSV